jgi:hypothetical protein
VFFQILERYKKAAVWFYTACSRCELSTRRCAITSPRDKNSDFIVAAGVTPDRQPAPPAPIVAATVTTKTEATAPSVAFVYVQIYVQDGMRSATAIA